MASSRDLTDNVGTREGQVAYLTHELKVAKRTSDKIRIMDKIADLRGLKIEQSIGDIRKLPTEEIEALLINVCVPALAPYVEVLRELVEERLSTGLGNTVPGHFSMSGAVQAQQPPWGSVRTGQRPPREPGSVSPEHGENKVSVRWESEWEEQSSRTGDQVVARGDAPVPVDSE